MAADVSGCCNSIVHVTVLVIICLSSYALLEALYMAIGLQAGEKDVKEPESKEKERSEDFGNPRASQFPTYGRPSS